MDKPKLTKFDIFSETTLHRYERYLPTAFDESLTLLEKMNKLIEMLNRLGLLTNGLIEEWQKVMDWVMNDGLSQAISDKLDQMVEDGTLAELISEQVFGWLTNNKQPTNAIFRKKPFLHLPMRFPDYNELVTKDDLKNYYPSAFDIDWEKKELFIVSLGATKPSGVSEDRLITVYDIDTGKYKGCFFAGVGGGEGLVIKYENGHRYLYIQHGRDLAAYNISELPANKSVMTPERKHNVNVHWTYANDGKNWLITQGGTEIGYKDQRTIHAYYNNSFSRLGFIETKQKDWGYFNADEYDQITKVQTMAIGNNKIYLGIGAYHADGATTSRGQIGLKVLDSSGELLESGLMDSQKVIDMFNANDIESDIMENEGVHVRRSDGAVFTLYVHLRPDHENAHIGGITIMQEYAPQMDAIDFSPCAVTVLGSHIEGFQPLSNNLPDGTPIMENNLTGERLSSMNDIINYMYSIKRHEFSFYSTTTPIKWFDGETIPGARFIKIYNVNNVYYWVEILPYTTRERESYFVELNPGTRDIKVTKNKTEGFATTYLDSIESLHDLDRGYYEAPLNNSMFDLPRTFPSADALTLITVKGSSTRKHIELFVPTTNQTFTTSQVNGFNNGYIELSSGGKLIDFNSQTKKKYLFIGNSFTYDATRRKLYDLLSAIDTDYTIGMIYQAGSDLNYHYNQIKNNDVCQYYKVDKDNDWVFNTNITVNEVLQDEEWQVISINQISGKSGLPFNTVLNDMIDLIKPKLTNRNAQFGLLMPWAYASDSTHEPFQNYDNDQIKMITEIKHTHEQLLKTNKYVDFVIPTGTMIQNARGTILNNVGNEITRDGYHLEYSKGRELAALMTYAFMRNLPITNEDLTNMTFTEEEKPFVITSVNDALYNPFGK